MKGQKNSVQKMLSPEEMSLLGTLQSTINELLALNNAGNTPAPENGGEANELVEALKKLAGTDLGDDTEEMGNSPAQSEEPKVEKEDNGPNANENAEQRSEPDSEVNDKNMSEVGKMLLSLFSKNNQSVNKSMISSDNQSQNTSQADVIAQTITKALKPIVDEVAQVKQFNSNILDALGFSEKIEKALPTSQNQNVNKGQVPVQTVDATGIVGELVNVIKSMTGNNYQNQSNMIDGIPRRGNLQEARKSLKNALPYIFSEKYDRNNK
jgi:hypothetical protein